MFVLYITPRQQPEKRLSRRKGSGGKGGGGKGGGGGVIGGGGGGGGSGGIGSGGLSPSVPISSSGSSKSASSSGRGGGRVSTIPPGQPFAGRSVGGGTRDQVYGNQQYGSGYPAVTGRGVAGRGFPFVFWPLTWGGVAVVGTSAYLHSSEYGRPDNSSRPGGVMMTAAFTSEFFPNTILRVIADNATVSSLVVDIESDCSVLLAPSSFSRPSDYIDSSPLQPKPEQAVQYYRASSVALTLDGYNNTGALAADGTPDTPLPEDIDTILLGCLNQTIGEDVPLVDGATTLSPVMWSTFPNIGLLTLVWIFWWSLTSFM